MTETTQGSAGETGRARIEVVDHAHRDWPRVLAAIDRNGDRERLRIGEHGWLSARQSVLVAFVGDSVAGYVAFSVQPGHRPAAHARPCVEAKLDAYGVTPPFCNRGVEEGLRAMTLARVRELQCKQVVDFVPAECWC